MGDMLTADELAARLKVKPDTVRGWARDNKIPAIRLSHKVLRFDFAAVIASLQKGTAEREAPAHA